MLATFRSTRCPVLGMVSVSLLTIALAGCATGSGSNGVSTALPAATGIHGLLHGGQQAVVGSQVYLYAAGTGSNGAASRSMLAPPGYVLSGANGAFNITGLYTCQAGDQVYILALGGDAGGGPNSGIGLMAALGPCSALSANTFTDVNEVTTVAAVYALAPYMTGPANVGAANANALAAAFASSRNMVDTTTGVAPAKTVVGNGVVPQTAINSLANSLAACINSPSGGGTCASLFADTKAGSVAPTNTVQAALNVANNPTQNDAAIYNLGAPQAPFQPTLQTAPSSYALLVSFPSDVLTYYNNTARTGVQPAETILTPANVNSASFGKKLTFPVDGYLYAQPLYVGGLGLPDGAVHDVVIASSVHGTVYAFDADGNNPAQGYLWKTSVVPAGETQVVVSDYFGCSNPNPETTLLSTPVIDRSTGTIYAVSKTKNTTSGAFVQRLHAISLIDGTEKAGSPVTITGTVASATGAGASGGTLSFDSLRENQRSALLLANGTVWIAWASHCDIGPYHGWVMGYNASTLAQNAVYANTPNGSDGGIWMAAGGPAADAQGYVYVIGGNGTFNAATNDLGDAGIKLAPPTSGLAPAVADYFVPSNQAALSSADEDVGVTQPLLFADPASSVAPQLMVETDKTGRVYLLNTAHMGTYDTGTHGPDGLNGDLQDFTIGGSIFNNFAYFNGKLYVGGSGLPLRAYAFTAGGSGTAGSLATSPVSQTTFNMPGGGPSGGTGPNISANGATNGIAWAITHSGGNLTLYAFDAGNLATELYGSDQAAGSRDLGPVPVKFTSAVVANGHVFVGGQSSLVVYGLLP